MKPALPAVALDVFKTMLDRTPMPREELRLRRLHDALGAGDSRAAWWDTVHKYHLELLVRAGFEDLRRTESHNLTLVERRIDALPSAAQIEGFVEDDMLDRVFWCGACLLIGTLLGALLHAVFAR